MRRTALGAALASLVLFAGCSGDAEEAGAPTTAGAADPAPSEPADPATDDASEAAEPATSSASAPADDAPDSAAGGGSTVLTGRVGTPEDPEAYEIALLDSSGEPVTSLPAGDYTIEVSDPSTLHNFHLTGESVDETTSVPELEETTFEVTLEPGEYSYVCDPHPNMSGSFTVT